jgi:hypothetical protein
MSNEFDDTEKMLVEVAASGTRALLRRIALVVRDSRASYAATALRGRIPMFSVESLAELRAALSLQMNWQLEGEDNAAEGSSEGVAGVDITRMALDDTRLFASHLGSTSQSGLVYVVTPDQIELFEAGTFDFVVR